MIKKLLFIFSCVLLSLPSLIGQQIKGGEITYKWVGNINFPHRYELNLVLITDIKLNQNSDVEIQYESSCFPGDTVPMVFRPGNLPGCFTPLPFYIADCVDSIYQEDIYVTVLKATVNLPGECSDWKFYYNECCRDSNSANILDPELNNFYIEAALNSTYGPNSSPVYGSNPTKVLCLNSEVPIQWPQYMYEFDGDSLFMELTEVLGDSGRPISFAPGYTIQQPFHSNPAVNFDHIHHILSFKPTVAEKPVLKLKVNEYRKDSTGNYNKTGHIMRDVLISFAPICSDDQINVGLNSPLVQINTPQCGNDYIRIETNFLYQGSSLSTDGSEFLLYNKYGSLAVDSAYIFNGNMKVFLTNPLVSSDSLSLVIVKGNDGNTLITECGFEWPENDSISFGVECYFDLEEKSTVKLIYPNPVENELYIRASFPEKSEYIIYTISGKQLLKSTLAAGGFMDVSDLPKGTFILIIKPTDDPIHREIFIKN